jgi:hypothetical protein
MNVSGHLDRRHFTPGQTTPPPPPAPIQQKAQRRSECFGKKKHKCPWKAGYRFVHHLARNLVAILAWPLLVWGKALGSVSSQFQTHTNAHKHTQT